MSALINTSKLSIYPSIINTQTPQAISPYFTSVIKTPTFKHIISASFNTMILLSEFSQNFSAESNCYISARTLVGRAHALDPVSPCFCPLPSVFAGAEDVLLSVYPSTSRWWRRRRAVPCATTRASAVVRFFYT